MVFYDFKPFLLVEAWANLREVSTNSNFLAKILQLDNRFHDAGRKKKLSNEESLEVNIVISQKKIVRYFFFESL